MNLYLDSTDIGSYLKHGGYSVFYKKILGPNSFHTLDGTYHEDIIVRKAVVTANLLPLTSEQLASIMVLCDNISQITYFDTKINAEKTVNATASVSIASVLVTLNSAHYWSDTEGLTLTLEEM